jgi:hypothetical protein
MHSSRLSENKVQKNTAKLLKLNMTFKKPIQKICIKPVITIHHLPAESLAPSSVKNSALPQLIVACF